MTTVLFGKDLSNLENAVSVLLLYGDPGKLRVFLDRFNNSLDVLIVFRAFVVQNVVAELDLLEAKLCSCRGCRCAIF